MKHKRKAHFTVVFFFCSVCCAVIKTGNIKAFMNIHLIQLINTWRGCSSFSHVRPSPLSLSLSLSQRKQKEIVQEENNGETDSFINVYLCIIYVLRVPSVVTGSDIFSSQRCTHFLLPLFFFFNYNLVWSDVLSNSVTAPRLAGVCDVTRWKVSHPQDKLAWGLLSVFNSWQRRTLSW